MFKQNQSPEEIKAEKMEEELGGGKTYPHDRFSFWAACGRPFETKSEMEMFGKAPVDPLADYHIPKKANDPMRGWQMEAKNFEPMRGWQMDPNQPSCSYQGNAEPSRRSNYSRGRNYRISPPRKPTTRTTWTQTWLG